MAYDVGGRGDQSFNDAAAAGLDKAKAELGVDVKEAAAVNGEAESARQERLQQLIDAGYNNIIAVGFAYAKAVGAAAKANPDVKFAIVDDASPDSAGPNVDQITFAEEQGSFLVGAAAALKTKTNHVGFIGGVQTDLIKKFEAGFEAGVKAVNPDIKIDVKYLTAAAGLLRLQLGRQGQGGGRGHVPGRRRRRLPRGRWLGRRRLHGGQGGRQAGHRRRLRPGQDGRGRRPRRHHHLDDQEGRRRRVTTSSPR